jgi:hypothetical protein
MEKKNHEVIKIIGLIVVLIVSLITIGITKTISKDQKEYKGISTQGLSKSILETTLYHDGIKLLPAYITKIGENSWKVSTTGDDGFFYDIYIIIHGQKYDFYYKRGEYYKDNTEPDDSVQTSIVTPIE